MTKVVGVSRMIEDRRALLVALDGAPSDDFVRGLHDHLRDWTASSQVVPFPPRQDADVPTADLVGFALPECGPTRPAGLPAASEAVDVGCLLTSVLIAGLSVDAAKEHADDPNAVARNLARARRQIDDAVRILQDINAARVEEVVRWRAAREVANVAG